MKRKFIFLVEELNKGNSKPYLIINEDEERDVPNSITVLEGDIDLDQSKWNGSAFEQAEEEHEEYRYNYDDMPSYYVWDSEKYYYKIDLGKYKENKIKELQKIREDKIQEDIEVFGHAFQVRSFDLENFYDITMALVINPSLANETINWRLSDNTFAPFTYAQIKEVLEKRGARKKEVFAKFVELESQVKSASNLDDVDEIMW